MDRLEGLGKDKIQVDPLWSSLIAVRKSYLRDIYKGRLSDIDSGDKKRK